VGSFARLQWQWPKEYVRPLSEALCRRVEEVDRKQHAIKDLQLVTLHFDGSMEPRDLDGQKSFKGKLLALRDLPWRPQDIVVRDAAG
jgi:hypothetical protein